jgi:hypothetical protein
VRDDEHQHGVIQPLQPLPTAGLEFPQGEVAGNGGTVPPLQYGRFLLTKPNTFAFDFA